MTLNGCVLDANNPAARPNPIELSGCKVVRLTALPGPDLPAYAEQLRAAGIRIALVLVKEGFDEAPSAPSRREQIRAYVTSVRPDYLIIGNEMDAYALGGASVASWTMRPSRFRVLYRDAVSAVDEATRDGLGVAPVLVGGGLVSGQPSELAKFTAVAPRLRHWDIHPYGKTATEARTLLRLYGAAAPNLTFCLFEWNRPRKEIKSYLRMLQQERIEAATYFAWHQVDIAGLHDLAGNPTPECTEFFGCLNS